jgi:hypothetical protein
LEKGVGLRYFQELLGHESSKTTGIYTHLSSALTKLAGFKDGPKPLIIDLQLNHFRLFFLERKSERVTLPGNIPS